MNIPLLRLIHWPAFGWSLLLLSVLSLLVYRAYIHPHEGRPTDAAPAVSDRE